MSAGETPDLETPGLETPGLETPGLETPGLETPDLEIPGLETHVICKVDDLAVGEARRFDIGDDHRIAVVRGEACWYAIDDECSHADYSLAEGEVDLEDCTVECWKHGSLFSLTTGEPETLPATRAVAVHPVREVDGEVAVDLPKVGE